MFSKTFPQMNSLRFESSNCPNNQVDSTSLWQEKGWYDEYRGMEGVLCIWCMSTLAISYFCLKLRQSCLPASLSKWYLMKPVMFSYGEVNDKWKSNSYSPCYLHTKWPRKKAVPLVGSLDTLEGEGRKVQEVERHKSNKFQDRNKIVTATCWSPVWFLLPAPCSQK